MEASKKKAGVWSRVLLSGALALAALCLAGPLTGCKDYDDDIDNLQNQINGISTSCQQGSTDVETLKKENEELKQQVTTLTNEKNETEKELKDAEKTIADLKKSCGNSKEGGIKPSLTNGSVSPFSVTPKNTKKPENNTPLSLSCNNVNGKVDVPGLTSVGGISIKSENEKNTLSLQTMYNVEGLLGLCKKLDCIKASDCKVVNGVPYVGDTALDSGTAYSCAGNGTIKKDAAGAMFVNDDSSMLKNKSYEVKTTGGPLTLKMNCGADVTGGDEEIIPEEENDVQDNFECRGDC